MRFSMFTLDSRPSGMIDYIIPHKITCFNRQYDDKRAYFTGLIVQNIELGVKKCRNLIKISILWSMTKIIMIES